jgi:hypothetical protein
MLEMLHVIRLSVYMYITVTVKVAKRGFIQHCSLKKLIVLLPPDEVPSSISRGAITPSGARALC